LRSTVCVVQLDQVAAVIKGKDFHVFGQDFLVQFLGLRLYSLQDVLGFLPGPQQDHALHGIIL